MVAVSDEYTLGILNSRLALRGIVAVEDRVILPPALKRYRKLARRAVFPKENLRQCGATLLAGIPGIEDRWDLVDPLRHIDVASGSNHDDCVFVDRAHLADQFVLSSGQLKSPIKTFSFSLVIEPDTNDNCIRLGRQFLGF